MDWEVYLGAIHLLGEAPAENPEKMRASLQMALQLLSHYEASYSEERLGGDGKSSSSRSES